MSAPGPQMPGDVGEMRGGGAPAGEGARSPTPEDLLDNLQAWEIRGGRAGGRRDAYFLYPYPAMLLREGAMLTQSFRRKIEMEHPDQLDRAQYGADRVGLD